MLDIGGWELLVIAAVALIVVGPKDLPGLVRNVGRWVSKARSLAREFQAGMEAAAKEADVDELRQIGTMKSDLERQVRDMGRKAQSMIDDPETETPRRERERERDRPRNAPAERVEPSFDSERGSERSGGRYGDRPAARPRDESYGRAGERDVEHDEALDRFQGGMRRRD